MAKGPRAAARDGTGPVRHFDAGARIGVLTTQPVDGVLDYLAPEGGCLAGAFVEVPLGPRRVTGVVWGDGVGEIDAARLRPAIRTLDVPPLRAPLRAFLERAAAYTMTPMPAMLRLATRVPGLGDARPLRVLLVRGETAPDRLTDARRRVLEALDDVGGLPVAPTELAARAGVSGSVVKGLVGQGVLVETTVARDSPYPVLRARPGPLALTDEQAQAAASLRDAVRAGFGATLLHGVTGSGKTEVYLEAVSACLEAGRQALVLLPEIALTAEFLARVEARFGDRPAEWHSGVTQAERRRCWHRVAEGQAGLVVGARSALFLPYRGLGLVVVDEEHDTAYKQEDGVLYNARDMAVLRGQVEAAAVVLASATPSLETWVNAEAGKYARLTLTSRFGLARLPTMRAVDMRGQKLPPGRWISALLQGEVIRRLEAKEQALLFLNRRGYAPVTVCRACGHQIGCEHCDARLVEHRFHRSLVCHQCGAARPIPETCPSCEAPARLAPVGPGVERLAEEAGTLFPDARIAVLSSDLYSSGGQIKAEIEAIAAGGADVIVGTQLVAKGHNFPRLTLVGVVDADLGLQGGDLRAAERTFALIRQVAGRAGRAERPGLALIQTWQPEHPVIGAILSGDETRFWAAEAAQRREARVPPYGRLAGIVLSSPDPRAAFDVAIEMARRDAPLRGIGAELWGPAPAPIARIRGRHRVRMLARADKGAALQAALSAWLAQVKLPANVRLSIDIDPQSFL